MSIIVLGFPGTSINCARKSLQTLGYQTIDSVDVLANCLSINDIIEILKNENHAIIGTPISLLWEDIAESCPETKFIIIEEDPVAVTSQLIDDVVSRSGNFYFKLVDSIILWSIEAGLFGQYLEHYRKLENELLYARVHPILTQSKYYFTLGLDSV